MWCADGELINEGRMWCAEGELINGRRPVYRLYSEEHSTVEPSAVDKGGANAAP